MKNIDLHTHSIYSDGSMTPTQLLKAASEAGLAALALTDHDTIQGLSEAQKSASSLEIEFIPGIEMAASSISVNCELHILGLYLDGGNDELNQTLAELRRERQKRNLLLCEMLVASGVEMEYSEVEELAIGGLVTRAHFAQLLIQRGFARNIHDAMNKYLGPGRPAYVCREVSTARECIRLIHQAGGLAFLAHPTLYGLNYSQISNITAQLKDVGLDGIEAFYSMYSNEDTAQVVTIAHKYKLLRCGGSDFHGDSKPDISLGCGRGHLRVPSSVLEEIKQKLSHPLPKHLI